MIDGVVFQSSWLLISKVIDQGVKDKGDRSRSRQNFRVQISHNLCAFLFGSFMRKFAISNLVSKTVQLFSILVELSFFEVCNLILGVPLPMTFVLRWSSKHCTQGVR